MRLFALLTLGLAACAGDESDSEATTSFAADIQPIFDSSCVVCHSGGEPASGQDLSDDAYDVIVGKPSVEVPAMNKVEPGSPEDSYLWHKVNGTHETVGGSGGQMPLDGTPLDAATLGLIETWINEDCPE